MEKKNQKRKEKKGKKALLLSLVLFIFLFALSSSSAFADFTMITDPGYGSQPDLEGPGGILDTLYGEGNLTRVHDFNASLTDQIWRTPDGTAAAVARYTNGADQTFGFYPGVSGGSFNPLFTQGDVGFWFWAGDCGPDDSPCGASAGFDQTQTGDFFRFANDSDREPIKTSQISDNTPAYDHMITYKITGNVDKPDNEIGNYVVAWDEYYVQTDFNDLVVEIRDAYPALSINVDDFFIADLATSYELDPVQEYATLTYKDASIINIDGDSPLLRVEKREYFTILDPHPEHETTSIGILVDLLPGMKDGLIQAIGNNGADNTMTFSIQVESDPMETFSFADGEARYGFDGDQMLVYLDPSLLDTQIPYGAGVDYFYQLDFLNYTTSFGVGEVSQIVNDISGTAGTIVPEIPAGTLIPVMGLIGFGTWFLRRKTVKIKK